MGKSVSYGYVLLFYSFFILVSSILNRKQGQAKAQRISGLPLIMEGWVQFQPHQCGILAVKVALGQLFLKVLPFSPICIILPMLHFHSFIHSSNTNIIQAGLILCNSFLYDFALTWFENLHFSNLCNNVQCNAIWHTDDT